MVELGGRAYMAEAANPMPMETATVAGSGTAVSRVTTRAPGDHEAGQDHDVEELLVALDLRRAALIAERPRRLQERVGLVIAWPFLRWPPFGPPPHACEERYARDGTVRHEQIPQDSTHAHASS